MGFDLWKMLGVSPVVGMGAAAAALVFAVLFAVRISLRKRGGVRNRIVAARREGAGLAQAPAAT